MSTGMGGTLLIPNSIGGILRVAAKEDRRAR
jgi:hypothetical protein